LFDVVEGDVEAGPCAPVVSVKGKYSSDSPRSV